MIELGVHQIFVHALEVVAEFVHSVGDDLCLLDVLLRLDDLPRALEDEGVVSRPIDDEGKQEADAQDVTQTVLLKLAEKMQTFVYDPSRSFRAWLKTVARHAWSDSWDSRDRAVASGGTEAVQMLHTVEAREDLLQRLEEEFDRELLEEAVSRVRQRVTPRTWRAYEMMAIEGRAGAETAQALDMKVATAFVAKSKVQKMLQEERQKLEEPGD